MRALASPGGCPDEFTSMLYDLKAAHGALCKAMTGLDRVTREPVPDRETFARERWNISRASLRRRTLWGRICASLSGRLTSGAAAELRSVQESDVALLHASRAHVQSWTTEAALNDWSGYAAASREIRWKMAAAIETERRILYPLLERLQAQGSTANR